MNREDLERWCSGRDFRDWIAGQVMGRFVIGSPYECLQFGVLQAYRVMLKPVIWIAACIVALLMMLSGCTTLPYNPADMSAEQLTAAAKDKNASVVCAIGNTPYGRAVIVTVNLDQKVIVQGTVTVDDTCKTTITNAPAPKP